MKSIYDMNEAQLRTRLILYQSYMSEMNLNITFEEWSENKRRLRGGG